MVGFELEALYNLYLQTYIHRLITNNKHKHRKNVMYVDEKTKEDVYTAAEKW